MTWPSGTGEMAARTRALNWGATPLGPIDRWPRSLRALVDLMLAAPQPAFIAWGPKLTSLYNDGYIPLLGIKHPDGFGQPYSVLWSEIWDQVRPIAAATLAGEPQHSVDQPVLTGPLDPATSWFTFSWTPIRDDAGTIAGFFCAATDTTARVRSERASRETQARLRNALAASRMGSFLWNVTEARGEADAAMVALFGLSPTAPLTLQALEAAIHPDDRRRYTDALARALDPLGDGRFHQDLRVGSGEQPERWVALTAQADFEASPRATLLAGAGLDITERRRAEEILSQSDASKAFLLRLTDALRPLTDASRIEETVIGLLAEHLAADRVFYGTVDAGTTTCTVHRDHRAPGVPSVVGSDPLAAHGPVLMGTLRSGHTLAIPDIAAEVSLSVEDRTAYASLDIQATLSTPIVRAGRWVALLGVHQRSPRAWTDAEVALIEATADHTWTAIEHARTATALRESEARLHALVDASSKALGAHRATEGALRTSLSESETQLREFHHRVKNNLEVINSQLQLQSDAVRDPRLRSLLRETSARVHAIAELHRLLDSSPDLARVDIHAYVEALARSLSDIFTVEPGRVRTVIDVEPVQLDLRRAVPTGLILNELISNALKHAFPGGRPGTLRIELRTKQPWLVLRVSDDGVGLDGPVPTESLGLKLVRILAEQLRGSVQLDGSRGWSARVQFPVQPG